MNHSPENELFENPVIPTKLSLDDRFQFRCHKDIACFNECCKQIDITLTPYDILRLQKRLEMPSREFLAQHTVPFEMDSQKMPGVKIRTVGDSTVCPFLGEAGCQVYEDRPTTCRYYALGLMSMRAEQSSFDEDYYFLIQEDHCLGHHESRNITIRDYRHEQGADVYDEINREWRQVILKKRSSGPVVGKPTLRSYQFFFMASYNLDGFRDFTQSPGFSEVYDLDAETHEQLRTDDVILLKFGFKLLKQVLFGEMTIPLKANAEEKRRQRQRELAASSPQAEDSDSGYDEPAPD
ncbi:MAG: YkgJ family cysteine cluster protein [Gammaproteobacteria bacterium]|nr:YkgJ family cysteine cluster protein [Gammaproteobacteria bacterium]